MANHPIGDNISTAAQASAHKWRVPASSSIAQWILESGWGVHSPGNNPFGMKPRAGMSDPQQMLKTTEFNKRSGEYISVLQPFRIFSSIAAAFDAHAQLIATAPVYASAMAELPAGSIPTPTQIVAFINKMGAHYATDPFYASKLEALIISQNLQRFDI